MRIALLTMGTRGDAQPMIVLGRELAARGHDVVLGVPPNLAALVTAAGLTAAAVGPDSQAVLESPEGQSWLASGNVRAFMAALAKIGHEHAAQTYTEAIDACAGADLIVAGILAEDIAACLGEAWNVPAVALHSAPLRATAAHASPMVTTRSLPGPLNRLSGAMFERIWWRTYGQDIADLRRQLDLPPTRRSTPARMATLGCTELQAYSPVVVPGLQAWPSRRPVVGCLLPDDALRADLGERGMAPDLAAWIEAGERPVYFGFGSMPVTDPPATLAAVAEVAERLGVRALVAAGWSRLAAIEDTCPDVRIAAGPLDHADLLPRCRAAVHHGGAGTTHVGLMAGIPAVICSVFADQPFWGARVERLGVGTHLPFARLDAASLEAALRTALRPDVTTTAQRLGARIAAEAPAAAVAADRIEQAADRRRLTTDS